MITLFSEPSLYPWFQFYKFCKNFVKWVIGRPILPYSGHFAVMRSIITGLTQAKVKFQYNPFLPQFPIAHAHVFANVNALRMAIFFKRLGLIKYLSAGPNLVISSADKNGILASDYIDKVVLNSEWTVSAYLVDNSKLQADKMAIWPAGVDTKYWDIKKLINTDINFLFYLKRPEKNLLEDCEKITLSQNIIIHKITHGNYNLDEFKRLLSQVDCVIYFVEQESQGIALSEIWATNTPTFVWNPGYWHYNSNNYWCSSAPYLTQDTGAFFRDSTEYKTLVENFLLKKYKFKPREYVLSNLSDEATTKIFLTIFGYNH